MPSKKPFKQPSLNLTDDGLHFDDSILWLDSSIDEKTAFISSPEHIGQKVNSRIITTAPTIALLKNSCAPLTCQYNRPFSIGKLTLELLPSGVMMGGASLHIHTDNGSTLYLPSFQNQYIACNRALQIKKADILITQATDPEPLKPIAPRKKEKEKLIEFILNSSKKGSWPIVICPPLPSAPEITQLLTNENFPLVVHQQIYKINNLYKKFGHDLGAYSLFLPNKVQSHAIIMLPPSYAPKKTLLNHHRKNKIFIDNSFNRIKHDSPHIQFNFPATSTGHDLIKIIKEVNPKTLYLFGPYAKKLAKSIKSSNTHIILLNRNNQPSLL